MHKILLFNYENIFFWSVLRHCRDLSVCGIINYWFYVVNMTHTKVFFPPMAAEKSLRGNSCHFNDFNKQNRKQFLPKTTKK